MPVPESQPTTESLSVITSSSEIASNGKPKIGLGLTLAVGGMILLQLAQSQTGGPLKKEPPGVSRGDAVLDDGVLPDKIGGWKKTKFVPPLAPEELPEHQWWWTHAWYYEQESATAFVAFDQADWSRWHELTVCYKAIGWELKKRKVFAVSEIPSQDWRYVVAEFQTNTLERATLVFSEFHDDASPTPPAEFELFAPKPEVGIEERFRNRINYVEPTENTRLSASHDRALQCQVLVTHRLNLTDKMMQAIIALHLESRRHFLDAWTAQKIESNKPATNRM